MIILCIDYGEARTGLAICDNCQILASPLDTIFEKDRGRLIERIKAVAIERSVGFLVVGEPLNMDGSRGSRAAECAYFAKELSEACALPYAMCDERLTTIQAHNELNFTNTRGKKRKKVVDSLAAVMILENYLARQRLV